MSCSASHTIAILYIASTVHMLDIISYVICMIGILTFEDTRLFNPEICHLIQFQMRRRRAAAPAGERERGNLQ